MLLSLFVVGSAHAVVIRHDVNDNLYTALGNSYASVGRIHTETDTTIGSASGVYIGSHNGSAWLLTAAHVTFAGTTTATVTFGANTFNLDTASRQDFSGGTIVNGKNDLALLKITGFNAAIGAAKLFNNKLNIPLGGPKPIGTSVGFGRTGTGNTGANGASGTKRGLRNRLDWVDWTNGGSTLWGYWADFDNNTVAANTLDFAGQFPSLPDMPASSKEPLDLEGITAAGDSGGALFANVDSSELLVGITSSGGPGPDGVGHYGSTSVWTPINATSSAWITEKTGITAVPEPGTMATLALGVVAMLRRRRRT
ncbi:MAG: PEP-CTERM sorting domain-containing protein [Chthonomonas sp.]|nr:PEP-CTERM sorting domain-containing protein [Chthonomonas sp.]